MTGNEALLTFALIAGGFLLGGVMFSRALPKLLTGKDVCALRADKNPGAANVFAVCGVPMGLLCLALDMLKAYLPVSLAAQWVIYLLPWPLLALLGRRRPFCSVFSLRPCVGSKAELSRAAMIAVVVQPKPISIGMNELPDRPNLRSRRSVINAARAI